MNLLGDEVGILAFLKKFVWPLALALFVLTAAAGPASAQPARTSVSIDNTLPRLYGYVSSPKPDRCAAHRRVRVIEAVEGSDVTVGVAKTRRSLDSWQWSLAKNKGAGRFYAKTFAKRGCRQDDSKTVKGKRKLATKDVPECTREPDDVCWLGFQNRPFSFSSGPSSPCKSFSASDDICQGYGNGGAKVFSGNQQADFSWYRSDVLRTPNGRKIDYHGRNGAYLSGYVPDPGSERFLVRDAMGNDDRHWCTPNLPGVGAGELGGPVYIDFENRATVGVGIYFWGYLKKRGNDGKC